MKLDINPAKSLRSLGRTIGLWNDKARNSYNEYDENCYLKSSAIFYEDSSAINDHLNTINSRNVQDETNTIEFMGVTFGENMSNVRTLLGQPKYSYRLKNQPNHVIVYYKFKLDGIGTFTSELHFYNDYMFMAKHLIENDSNQVGNWIENIKLKYDVNGVSENSIITNSSNQSIHIKNNVIFEICYSDISFIESYANKASLERNMVKEIEMRKNNEQILAFA